MARRVIEPGMAGIQLAPVVQASQVTSRAAGTDCAFAYQHSIPPLISLHYGWFYLQ